MLRRLLIATVSLAIASVTVGATAGSAPGGPPPLPTSFTVDPTSAVTGVDTVITATLNVPCPDGLGLRFAILTPGSAPDADPLTDNGASGPADEIILQIQDSGTVYPPGAYLLRVQCGLNQNVGELVPFEITAVPEPEPEPEAPGPVVAAPDFTG